MYTIKFFFFYYFNLLPPLGVPQTQGLVGFTLGPTVVSDTTPNPIYGLSSYDKNHI